MTAYLLCGFAASTVALLLGVTFYCGFLNAARTCGVSAWECALATLVAFGLVGFAVVWLLFALVIADTVVLSGYAVAMRGTL